MDISAIETQLEAQGCIAIIWSIEDVQDVRPDLTLEQCKDLLRQCKEQHDADIGITWAVIRIHADDLFPTPEEAAECLKARAAIALATQSEED
jgi:hypothetical protein